MLTHWLLTGTIGKASGPVSVLAQASVRLQDTGVSGSGAVLVAAQTNVRLAGTTVSSSGAVRVIGHVSAILADAVVTSTGRVIIRGQTAIRLQGSDLSGSATVVAVIGDQLSAFPDASLTGGQIVGVSFTGGILLTGWPTGGTIKRLQ